KTPVAWTTSGSAASRIEISRRSRLVERPGDPAKGEKPRTRRIGVNDAADDVVKAARDSGRVSSGPTARKGDVDGSYATFVEWTEGEAASAVEHETVVFASGDWIFEVRGTGPATDSKAQIESFVDSIVLSRIGRFETPTDWYERRFGWTSPLPFNAFFSIG